ncbi:hypothetical protein LGL55_21905 [Clostridium tagluense]|uniref:hypothetical protein n=1 Tax=Clostridium tagluense TaxID=360422 RepID=UPI001CF53144|nr:hypothetical protein [Clostridium tagluense]MCB2313782.1 hypothetical protein [Clostridium tagluense]MCB2318599.1 hypothetical protein [Clostridium tagluense]MCB2323445.1 hypothetical protein [Clostridium tagluense]MCB2328262.1 hypothetical protein [Clostridium tagluense]MCB2333081.1 hypothetical protein [Clostridium tagluense]
MTLKKELFMISLLFIILYLTKSFYDSYRLFVFFTPIYLWLLYDNLRNYYSYYSITRFSAFFSWQKKLLLIIGEYSIIGALILSIDNVFISNIPANTNLIGALFLQYFLFLSLLGVVLIIFQLSYRRSIITAVILLLLSMTDIPIFRFLITLYDLRQIKNTNIFLSIIYFFVLNIISYSVYLINNKLKGGSYEYS